MIDPKPDCPQSHLHTPQPRAYVEWFEWAASMNYRGHSQSRCPGCSRYYLWRGGRP